MTIYLGIETSCDETAVAIVEDGRKVLANKLLSQSELHKHYGGVVPEIAARQHLETINWLVEEALLAAQLSFAQTSAALDPAQSLQPCQGSQSGQPSKLPQLAELDAIAFTAGPGLVGALMTGMAAAKALAWVSSLPLIAVDHLLAHVCANYIETELEPPFLALLVSGGHTQIIYYEDYRKSTILGETLDDAAGEAYDKIARLLNLAYPGGPLLDKLAQTGDPHAFAFPEGAVAHYNFSFSGLKTAVARVIAKLADPLPAPDIAASFQEAVTNVLVKKTLQAQKETKAPVIAVAGGVAANSALRSKLLALSPVPVIFPRLALCTDNAVMVAAAAHFCGNQVGWDAQVYSRQPI